MTDKEKKELEVSRKQEIAKDAGEPFREGVTFVPEVDILESDEGITLQADIPSENLVALIEEARAAT